MNTPINPKYLSDWSGLQRGTPEVIHFPKTTAEVATIVQNCHEKGQTITIQGGLTGLTGGASPGNGDVILNLEKMNRIEHIDPLEGIMVVQAGVTLYEVQEAAKDAGWFFPVDLGSRGSCLIGGNASTNAGGERVLRYGTTRDSILGLEVVLADGTILDSMTQLVKNSTGLDLRYLFIGSEGTLGIITRLVLRLQAQPGITSSALLAIDDFKKVPEVLRALKQTLGSQLSTFEFMSDKFVQLNCDLIQAKVPINPCPAWSVLVEAEGSKNQDILPFFEQSLSMLLEQELINDAIIAQSDTDRLGFWKIRQSIPEVLSHIKPNINFDLGLPLKYTESFIKSLTEGLNKMSPHSHHLFFGHLGDNNIHLITGPHPLENQHAVEDFVYGELAKYSGTISAEHGIGFIKKPYLHLSRNSEQLDLLKKIKCLMDPKEILNPNRII